MLRALVSVLGLALCAGGAYMIARGRAFIIPGAIDVAVGALIFAGLFFEPHYRNRVRPGRGNWQPTAEKFIDPGTGKLVEVDYDPQTGQREYRDAE